MSYSIMEVLFNGKVIPWERRNTDSAGRKTLEAKKENEKRHFIEKCSRMIAGGFKLWKICIRRRRLTRK